MSPGDLRSTPSHCIKAEQTANPEYPLQLGIGAFARNAQEFAMIRPATHDDRDALIALADATGLFAPSELAEIGQMLADHLSRDTDSNHSWITDEERGELTGIAYFAPERMTEGTWNLYLIGVHPNCQGQGRGTELLRYIEQALTARGERLLLVETSGLPSFDRTRAFYLKCGYNEEARIRDFYSKGIDKIVYAKALGGQRS
jgi:ribosomal protein S18 acetylase RimI-like enzyme